MGLSAVIGIAHIVLLAQLQLAGGASSLFNAAGASATLYRPTDQTTVSAGVAQGKVVGGLTFRTGNWTVGDQQLGLSTGEESVYLPLRGVTYEIEPQLNPTCPEPPARRLYGVGSCRPRRWNLLLVAGLTGDAFTVPFFAGMRATAPTAGARFTTPIGNVGSLALVALVGMPGERSSPAMVHGVYTVVPEFDLKRHWLEMSLAGGVVQGQRLFDSRFAFRSKHIGASVAHANYFAPERITLDSAGVAASLGPWSAYASAFRSRFHGEALGTSYRIAFVQLSAGYLIYDPIRTVTASASENLTRRIGISQFLTRSGGRTTYNFGGNFRSNLLTASFGYQEYWTPTGFQSLPTASVSLQLPRSITLNLSMVGKLWTSYGGTFVGGPVGSSASLFAPKLKEYVPVTEQ